ncbi:carbohydrate porin [Leptolyngbya sp. FACHB-261]|uniref:carbohydrate porin n=1 Tax=Leptolyngbya sp. FACHB-261 TaxID=2692806 RepID=UPI0016836A5C|nr:carbohydrate porin [Leptolyngbya sp. FACHB-261]MBD2104316.1 carbohydrate porin [Leptolyngbya sp. FACHB-261]
MLLRELRGLFASNSGSCGAGIATVPRLVAAARLQPRRFWLASLSLGCFVGGGVGVLPALSETQEPPVIPGLRQEQSPEQELKQEVNESTTASQSTPQPVAPPEAIERPAVFAPGEQRLQSKIAPPAVGSVPAVTPLPVGSTQMLSQSASDLLPATTGSDRSIRPRLQFQGLGLAESNEDVSLRLRLNGLLPLNQRTVLGATLESRFGSVFGSDQVIDLNELFITHAVNDPATVRFTVGKLDLTSYFDRNSFAKDIATHFFNPAFQTNPALGAAGLSSQPALLFNWTASDNFEVKLSGFSSQRDLGDLSLDSFAGELGLRLSDWGILRATYVTSVERDQGSSGQPRQSNIIAVRPGDREQAFGLNFEAFLPDPKLGFFARYGHYDNLDRDQGSANAYSVGVTALDVWVPQDRMGLGYGTLLSNSDLRDDLDRDFPDALELFYDRPLNRYLRIGASVQGVNGFSDVVFGLRLRTDLDLLR